MVVVEHETTSEGTNWYIGFDAYDSEPDQRILCKNEHEAIKLQRLINGHIRKWYKSELNAKPRI